MRDATPDELDELLTKVGVMHHHFRMRIHEYVARLRSDVERLQGQPILSLNLSDLECGYCKGSHRNGNCEELMAHVTELGELVERLQGQLDDAEKRLNGQHPDANTAPVSEGTADTEEIQSHYWCGCKKWVRWERCEEDAHLESDDGPPSQYRVPERSAKYLAAIAARSPQVKAGE